MVGFETCISQNAAHTLSPPLTDYTVPSDCVAEYNMLCLDKQYFAQPSQFLGGDGLSVDTSL